MTLSPFALEDVEALCLEPLLLMADPVGPLLDNDHEAASTPSSHSSPGGRAPPPSSPSPYQSFSKLSPDSPMAQSLADSAPLSPSWLMELPSNPVDDYDPGMDWMSEKMDLSELDLESLIGSCSSDGSPSSPEELLASLDSQMSLDLDDFNTAVHYSGGLDLSLPHIPVSLEPAVAESRTKLPEPPQEELVKTEPSSPLPLCPSSTIELGSEVDVLEVRTSLTAAVLPDPSSSMPTPIVLSIPAAGHLLVVLTSEEDPVLPFGEQIKASVSSDSDSDSGIESVAGSPTRTHSSPPSTPPPVVGSSRTKPYSKPEPPSPLPPKVKTVSGAPRVVERKMKKMEQNKTAATRYRQKKRVEQEQRSTELEELEKKNQELEEKAGSISREIQYLKDLMEEVRKHHRGKSSPVA